MLKIAAALKRSTKRAMTSSNSRAPSKKHSSNKIARKMQYLNVLSSCVSRGPPMLVYRFRCANYVPKLMKSSLEKISFIQILGDKIFIAIVSKYCKRFLCYISTSFYVQFWTGASAPFIYTLLLILAFPKHI